jgi:hypothetical protein
MAVACRYNFFMRGHLVVQSSDPTVVFGEVTIDVAQAAAPVNGVAAPVVEARIYQTVVKQVATAHQLSVLLADLLDHDGVFELRMGTQVVQQWNDAVPGEKLPLFLDSVNQHGEQAQVYSTGNFVVFTSQVLGTAGRLSVTRDGATISSTDSQAPMDAAITVDGAQLNATGNSAAYGRMSITAASKGTATITVSYSHAPTWVFPVCLGYLLLLPIVAALVHSDPAQIFHWLPNTLFKLPTVVLLFGALGAVLLSLQGLFFNNTNWLPSYNFWYLTRPFVGAALGFVAVLIFVALVNATQATSGTTAVAGANSETVYVIIAFVVGFREQTFRNLMTKVVDVFLGPGGVGSESGTPAGTADS